MKKSYSTEILVVGGGASGVCAAIQAARLGRKVILVEETPWLGGMLTAAGVSAIDGNHHLPSGLWGEFRQRLYEYYGGPEKVKTGWVSHTLFEPKVGNAILTKMASVYPDLRIFYGFWPIMVRREKNKICGVTFVNEVGEKLHIHAIVTIEATECGDVIALANIPYIVGRESRDRTGEHEAPQTADNIIQDLTYVAILKDYGFGQDKTIARPPGYNPTNYRCTCRELCDDPSYEVVDAQKMLDYGRLPNNKFMINWPVNGNDYYLNVIEMTHFQRLKAYQKAKNFTLGWIYFIQTQGGFKNLGLADDEFPTTDFLPFIPYHRESRRMEGIVKLTVKDIIDPYADAQRPFYKMGIAVGDYPLDHHHAKSPVPIHEKFPPIPSFSIPYACLIPSTINGLIVAEKSISVSHIVNGCTRLQPCVMLIGQAAGAAAALCVIHQVSPVDINIRQLQQILLDAGCWCLPYLDVSPESKFFQAVQRCGLSGVMRGEGIAKAWANETRFHPDQEISGEDFYKAMVGIYPNLSEWPEWVTIQRQKNVTFGKFFQFIDWIIHLQKDGRVAMVRSKSLSWSIPDLLKEQIHQLAEEEAVEPNKTISRKLMAYFIDKIFQPFQRSTLKILG